MSNLFNLVQLDQLQDLFIDKLTNQLASETISIESAQGRILSQDISSKVNLPPFSRSTMDGYALKAEDTFGASDSMPLYLDLVGEVLMGQRAREEVQTGQAVKIATGGMLPQGADAVLMVEYTEPLGSDMIEITKSVSQGENIVQVGEDIKEGQLLLSHGHRLRPQDIGALAGIGITEVEVFLQPTITIFSTGDELVKPSATPTLGKIRDINSYSIGSFVDQTGGKVIYGGIIKDNKAELISKLEGNLEKSDLIILSGGSSVGTKDLTIEVLNQLGYPGVLVHGISIKPGKPTILAIVDGTPIIGLPGHPTSAMVVFKRIVAPIINQLAGVTDIERDLQGIVPAILSRNLASDKGREEYVRVKLEEDNGRLSAVPVLGKSSLVSTMVKADGLVKIDFAKEGLAAGAEVKVRLFD